MNITWFLSIFIFIVILHFSAAVECPSSDIPYFEIECPACAVYICGGKSGSGCPDDFFRDCSIFKNAIKFIDSKNYLYLNYFDRFVTYVSGCEQELDGQPCIQEKVENFKKEIANYKGGILWNASGNQNGAIKLIGILGIGWIIFTVWIY
uniref:Uncharacterized protein n=1 Tax=Panagrolaimus davidi TaxID=227884 RepID=A0A914PKY2_9BILA